jgi:hypothetical protein
VSRRPPTPPASPSRDTAKLGVIRVAMLAGVLSFGAVSWFVRRQGTAPASTVDPGLLGIAGSVIWGLAVLGILVLFLLLRNRETPARRSAFSIIGWALGESVALFGGVYLFLIGDPKWFLAGLTALLLTFFIFPLRRR